MVDPTYQMQRLKYTGNGPEIPETVIGSPTVARAMYQTLRSNHLDRILLFAEIDGLLQGNPPYDQHALEEAGLGHISNFNTLEPRSLFERVVQAYWTCLFNTQTLISITVDLPIPEAVRFGRIMSTEWQTVIDDDWSQFSEELMSMCKQLVKYGVSPIVWNDERTFKFQTVELNRFYIPDRSKNNLAHLTQLCLETEWSIPKLIETYNFYKDKDVSNCPWDLEELKHLITFTANNIAQYPTYTDDLAVQQKRSSRDIDYTEVYNENLKLITFFYTENNGKVSRYMFHETIDNGNFLYTEREAYDSLEEVLLIFTRTPGDIYIWENKGFGHLIYPMSQAMIMLDNSILDMGKWASTPLITDSPDPLRSSEPIRFAPGVATNLGSAQLQNNTMGSNLNGVVAGSQYFTNKLEKNTVQSGDDPGQPDRSIASLSGTQVKMRAYNSTASVQKNYINHFYRIADSLYKAMVVKMLHSKLPYPDYDISKRWKDRCIAKGVPEEMFSVKGVDKNKLPEFLRVKATRVAGAGSQAAHLIGLQEIGPLAGSFGRREQEEYKTQFITAALGAEFVTAFTQDSQNPDEVSGGASLAQVENNSILQGNSALFSLSNDHRAHITVHLALMTDTMQQVMQGQIDVVQADRIFTLGVPHLNEHFAAIQQNIFAQAFVEQVKQAVNQVNKYAVVNRRNATAALRAQAEQEQQDVAETQAVLNEEERKNVKVQGDEARANYKVQSQVERAKEANVQRGEALQKITEAKVQAIRAKTNAESGIANSANPPVEQSNASAELQSITSSPITTPFNRT